MTHGRSTQVRLMIALGAVVMCAASAGWAEDFAGFKLLFAIGGDGPSQPFRNAQGAFYDWRFDEIYIADTGNHRIVILDRDGYPLHSFPHYVTRNGKRIPGEPKSVAVNSRGHIFVVDALDPGVDVMDSQGILLGRILPDELIPGKPSLRAETITVDARDRIYLGVSGHFGGVLHLGEGCNLVSTFPALDSKEQTEYITGVWVDGSGNVYVTDPSGVPAVRVFDPNGDMRLAFGKHDVGYDNFSRPSAVAVTAEGTIWVVDMIRQVVKAFDPKGTYMTYLGGQGSGPGSLDYPSAVTTDGKDRIYVMNRRVGGLVCFDVGSGRALASTEEAGRSSDTGD